MKKLLNNIKTRYENEPARHKLLDVKWRFIFSWHANQRKNNCNQTLFIKITLNLHLIK